MGMKKTSILEDVATTTAAHTIGTAQVSNPAVESGAEAAIERLSKVKASKAAIPTYKARDYEAEAIGKTRCVQFEAALMSPAIAGMKFDTMEEYLKLVRIAAEAGVTFSFEK